MYVKKPLGADVSAALDRAVSTLDAAKVILDDPALPEVTRLILKLNALQKKPGTPAGPPTKGVGLKKFVTPLKVYVKTQEQPILGYAIIAAIIAIPFMLGMRFGSK